MKNRIITTLVAAAGFILAAPAAEAQCDSRQYHGGYHGGNHHGGYRGGYHGGHQQSYVFISGYQRCGTPVYSERYIKRYDRRGFPVYGYRVIRHRPQYVSPAPRGYHVAPCPPPRYGSYGHISIRF